MRWERIRPIRRDRRAIRKFNVETEAFAIQHRTVAAFETVPVAGIVGQEVRWPLAGSMHLQDTQNPAPRRPRAPARSLRLDRYGGWFGW